MDELFYIKVRKNSLLSIKEILEQECEQFSDDPNIEYAQRCGFYAGKISMALMRVNAELERVKEDEKTRCNQKVSAE